MDMIEEFSTTENTLIALENSLDSSDTSIHFSSEDPEINIEESLPADSTSPDEIIITENSDLETISEESQVNEDGSDSMTGDNPDDTQTLDESEVESSEFDSGVFTVGEDGEIEIDFLFDGGKYKGELALFSLKDLDEEPGSEAFIKEAASRALSSSELGHIVISDSAEGSRFSGVLGEHEEENWNSGEHQDGKTFTMNPGDEFGILFVPNGKVQEVFDDPSIDGYKRPLFSMTTANPDDIFEEGLIADLTGCSHSFAMEDAWGPDQDYNDLLFEMRGATGDVVLVDDVINSELDWRETELGQDIFDYIMPAPVYQSGVFTVGESGEVDIDFLFDGGKWQGELALFNLEGMEEYELGCKTFIEEAAFRAISRSELGHVVISDPEEGARFTGILEGYEDEDWNKGEYQGIKGFEMTPGDEFGFMFIPNGTVEEVLENPDVEGSKRPLFSMTAVDSEDVYGLGTLVDVTGDRNSFGFDDQWGDPDGDYNDLVFQVDGATGGVELLTELIEPENDWRNSEPGEKFTQSTDSDATPLETNSPSDTEAKELRTIGKEEHNQEKRTVQPEEDTEVSVANQKTNLQEQELDDDQDSIKTQESDTPKTKGESSFNSTLEFDSGIFLVTGNGEVSFDWLYDGGKYKGEVGIFSLKNIDTDDIRDLDTFIEIAAQRVTSNSTLGYVIFSDREEGAGFGEYSPNDDSWNAGTYKGRKTFTMEPGEHFGIMLVPNGTFENILDNPESEGAKRPLFSMATANPEDYFHLGQIADVTGDSTIFTFEDRRVDQGSDKDYNDFIFRIDGAQGDAPLIDELINSEVDWRETDLGKELLEFASSSMPTDIPIIALNKEGKTRIELEEIFSQLSKDEEWKLEVLDAGVHNLNPQVEGDVLIVGTQPDIEIEYIVVQATNASGDSYVQRLTLIVNGLESDTTNLITDLLKDFDDIFESLLETPESEMTQELSVLVDRLDQLIEDQPVVLKFLVQPNTLPFLGLDQSEVEAAHNLIHSEDVGQLMGVPDTLHNALTESDNSSWEEVLIEANSLPSLSIDIDEESFPRIGFIDSTKQDHDEKTLETFKSINELDNQEYTLIHIDDGNWTEKLTQFIDQIKANDAPGGLVNLGFDLTQDDDLEHTTTRYELTPTEQEAIQYARDNNVLLVVAAGNTGDQMSALGEASQTFDNILVVGAVDRWQEKADYSAQGDGLSLVAPGGQWETNPKAFVGTSKATAYVTAAASLVWRANPELNYQQVKETLLQTADDLGEPGWDSETGAGLLDVAEAILLAQKTEGQTLAKAEPVQVEPFSGEGRVETSARPTSNLQESDVKVSEPSADIAEAEPVQVEPLSEEGQVETSAKPASDSDLQESDLNLLEPSADTQVQLWDNLLQAETSADSSLAQQTFEALEEYQQLKTDAYTLSVQEDLIEEGLDLVGQQTQVESEQYLTLQDEYQTLTQEIQNLSFDKSNLETPTQGDPEIEALEERSSQLQNEITFHKQQQLNSYIGNPSNIPGIVAEIDGYEYELQAVQDLLSINRLKNQQKLEAVNLELNQKQERIAEIEQELLEVQENVAVLDLELGSIPNQLEDIQLAGEEVRENLQDISEIIGISLPYRERINAAQSQVEYLEQRLEELPEENDNLRNAVIKESEFAKAYQSALVASNPFKSSDHQLENLVSDLKDYQTLTDSDDLLTQQYIQHLEVINDSSLQALLTQPELIANNRISGELAYRDAEQNLEQLWEDHIQLNLQKSQIENFLSDPDLESQYLPYRQIYEQSLEITEDLLEEKYKAIQLTERYIEQAKGFVDQLQDWETFLKQVDAETAIYEEQDQQWEISHQEQTTVSQAILDNSQTVEAPLLKLKYLSEELELLKTIAELDSHQNKIEQLRAEDKRLEENQIIYYNRSLEHKANTWKPGFYSASEALADRDNYQEASLIADKRNQLWVQIQSELELINNLEIQKEDKEAAVNQAKQKLAASGQEITEYSNETELQNEIKSILAQYPLFSQIREQLLLLGLIIVESENKQKNLRDAVRLRTEAARRLVALGLLASESDPDFFSNQIEPQIEAFIRELQQQYRAVNTNVQALSQIAENLENVVLYEEPEDLNFVKQHLDELENWQQETLSEVGELQNLLVDAWDSLAILRQQKDLDEQLKAPRPELVTIEAAEEALSQNSIQGNAQLHDQVAGDLVGAVTAWTKDLQASHQITQDLVAAQHNQSQAVDDLITTIQKQLSDSYGQYQLARSDLRDIIITHGTISNRDRGFEQSIEDSQNRIEQLQLMLQQDIQFLDQLTPISSSNKFYTDLVDNLQEKATKNLNFYDTELNQEKQNSLSAQDRLIQLNNDLSTIEYQVNFFWKKSRDFRKKEKWPNDSSEDVIDGKWYERKKNKGPFGLITWSKETIEHTDNYWYYWQIASNKIPGKLEEIRTNEAEKQRADARIRFLEPLTRQWREANEAAFQAQWQIEQVRNLLEQLNAKREEIPELKTELEEKQSLLLALEQQALEAQEEALGIQASLEQAWEEFTAESQEYKKAAVDVSTQRSEVDRQALQYRSMLAEIERWVEGQNIATDQELQQANAIRERLERAVQAVQLQIANSDSDKLTELKTQEAQLQKSLTLLLSKVNVLEARQKSLIQKRALIAASDAVIVVEEKLLHAYLISPDQDTSTLEAELSAAREALAETQRLAEQAEASSQALTQPLQELREELLAKNDEHIQQARNQQQILSELREATELNLNYTLEATQAQQRVNEVESQIIIRLEEATAAGSREAEHLLQVAMTNDMATAAELFYTDYNDLASDSKHGRPEDRLLADQYYQEWQSLLVVKKQEKQQADYWRQVRQKAEKRLEGLKTEQAKAQAKLDERNAEVAETQEEIQEKEQALAIAQIRLESITQLRNETERMFIQLASLEQLNFAQAQLEVQIAEKRDADIEQSLQDRLVREQQEIDRKRKVVLAQIEQLKQVQTEANLQQTLNEIRGELGMTDLDVIESPVQLQTQMANLLNELNTLETEEPDLPDNLKALLAETKGDIYLALQGEEATNIQANLLAVADGIVEQIEKYKAELAEIDRESQQEVELLKLAQSDVQKAAQEFVKAAEANQELREQLNALNIEYGVVLEGIDYAEQQIEISEQWAAEARAALEQIIAQREEARKQRKKAFWNKVLGGISKAVGLVGTIVSFVPGLQAVGIGLIAAGAGINAIQSAVNGDWAGAIFSTVMAGVNAVTAGAGNLIGQVATNTLKGLQAAASGAFNSIRSIKSGDAVLGALQILGGAAGAASQGLQKVFSQLSSTTSKAMSSVLNGLQQAPQMIYGGIEAIKNGDWYGAIKNFFQGAINLGKSFASFFNDATNETLKYIDKVGNTGLTLADAVNEGGVSAWLSGIDSLLGTWEEEIQAAVDQISDKEESEKEVEPEKEEESEEEALEKQAEKILASVENLSNTEKLLALGEIIKDLPDDLAATVISDLNSLEDQVAVLEQLPQEQQGHIVHELPTETKKEWAEEVVAEGLRSKYKEADELSEGDIEYDSDGKLILDIYAPSRKESAIDFISEALLGEFNEDPSIGQIILDAAIGAIPIVGEIGDVRDLAAYTTRFANNPDEMKDPLNWLGVGSSLIGLIPVVGGPLKGLVKGIQKSSADSFIRKSNFADDIPETLSVRHAVTDKRAVRSILDEGIDPKRLSPDSRFGSAFHVAREGDTAIAEATTRYQAVTDSDIDDFLIGKLGKERYGELSETDKELYKKDAQDLLVDQRTVKSVIIFELRDDPQKILNLSDPKVAKEWGYSSSLGRTETQRIGEQARKSGFSGIRYPSVARPGGGDNYAIFEDFDSFLSETNVTPGNLPIWITVEQ